MLTGCLAYIAIDDVGWIVGICFILLGWGKFMLKHVVHFARTGTEYKYVP
jgi:hypothetical protein